MRKNKPSGYSPGFIARRDLEEWMENGCTNEECPDLDEKEWGANFPLFQCDDKPNSEGDVNERN